jgi:hypothetical protein
MGSRTSLSLVREFELSAQKNSRLAQLQTVSQTGLLLAAQKDSRPAQL